jgi:pyrroline-5-carboxylate reductase
MSSGDLRVGFLGAGMMAEALARGFDTAGVAQLRNMTAFDVAQPRREVFASAGATVVSSNQDVVARADVLFICVKPYGVKQLLQEVGPSLTDRHLVVSIAAGVTLADLQAAAGPSARVVRVMPNTPCMVGTSVSRHDAHAPPQSRSPTPACSHSGQTAAALCLGAKATPADGELVTRLLNSVGRCYTVQENLLDAVTGLSGSGPAYVFLIIEALSDGGVRAGLPRDIATGLAAQTVAGAAAMVLQTGKHTGELKDMVTSPGGTTIAGVHALETGGVRAALMDAVVAATNRAKELSKL